MKKEPRRQMTAQQRVHKLVECFKRHPDFKPVNHLVLGDFRYYISTSFRYFSIAKRYKNHQSELVIFDIDEIESLNPGEIKLIREATINILKHSYDDDDRR